MRGGIIVVPPGCLKDEDHQKANAAGYCVIECDNPDAVRFLTPEYAIYADDLAMAALEAIQGDSASTQREKFAKILYQKLKAKTPPND